MTFFRQDSVPEYFQDIKHPEGHLEVEHCIYNDLGIVRQLCFTIYYLNMTSMKYNLFAISKLPRSVLQKFQIVTNVFHNKL